MLPYLLVDRIFSKKLPQRILLLITLLQMLLSCKSGNIHFITPDQSIQKYIDRSNNGDILILKDGVYFETIHVNKELTIKAEHPGEVCITNKYKGDVKWIESPQNSQVWYASGINWPVHRMLINGIHAFDYRSKENFDNQECGPFWSKGWQEGKTFYGVSPVYFAWESITGKLWLKLDNQNDPNQMNIEFNSSKLGGKTLVQKDLGTGWNQQEIVQISQDPSEHPVIHWYEGTKENPSAPRYIDFPKICGIVIDIHADNVRIEGIKIHMAPTVGVEVNNSKNVTIHDCYLSGYQYAINTGYECTNLTVTNCEMDGGLMVSKGGHTSVFIICGTIVHT